MSEPTSPEPPEPASPTFGSRLRQFFVAVGIVAVVGLGVSGFVLYRERGAQQQFEGEVAKVQAECDGVRAALEEARQGESRLHAFIDVVGARDQLAKGNFGNARARMEAAAVHLESGGDTELATRIRSVDIQITQDLETTQDAIVAIERAVEAVIDHPEPEAAE